MNIVEKALKQTQKEIAAAKDGSMKYGGVLYTLKFNKYQGYYEVTNADGFSLNITRHKLSEAKKVLTEWLEN